MIPLYKPFMPDVPLVDEILHSGRLAYGRYGREFEESLAAYLETPNVIVTNAFNMAILVALSTLGIGAGAAVIASPMACLASTQPLLSMGIKVRWADVDPETGTLCPESVGKLMTAGPAAIIHNHFCGHVGFIDEINDIGRKHAVPVIDDCIEAFGSEYKGKKLGNVGTDVTVFSFNPVRLPNTLDGGAIVFKDQSLLKKSILVRDCGIDRKRFRDELGEINPDCDIELVGHSATMNEVSSYIGIQQMRKVKDLLAAQRENASAWDKKIAGFPFDIRSLKRVETKPNYWVYGTLAGDKMETIKYFRQKGFYASGVHLNNNIYSVFNDRKPLKGTKEFQSKFVALPCGWWMWGLEW